MDIGTIKRIRVNPKTDIGAILFEDGKAYYIKSLGMVKSLMRSYKHNDPIGETIGYELSNEKHEGEGIIKRIFVKNMIIS